MSMLDKFEKKLKEIDAIFTFNESGEKSSKKYWCVWYKRNNSDQYTVMTNSYATTKTAAENRKNKLTKAGVFSKEESSFGLGELDLETGKLTLDKKKEEESKKEVREVPKEHDKFAAKIAQSIRKDIFKSINAISQIDIDEFVVLDTETTGIKKTDEVIELAAIRLKNYKVIDKFHAFINPTVSISKGAFDVHGLSKEFLEKNGRSGDGVFEEFKKFVGNTPVVGHNVKFDKGKIENHARKAKIVLDLSIGFDTLELSRKMMNLANHKLEFIIDQFGLRKGLKSHNAMDDVVATARYARTLDKIYRTKCMDQTDAVI